MVVQFPRLVCNRTVAKNHREVQCNLCDYWVHIGCNHLNLYTYQKIEKGESPWYCLCCFWRELPHRSVSDTKLGNLLHGEANVTPNPKIISSIIKQKEYFAEEILKKRQTIDFILQMNLTLHWKASIWHHNCSVCISIYYHHLELYVIYFPILKLNQI